MKKRTESDAAQIERFYPSPSTGLTAEQVAKRTASALTNHVEQKYSKSYLSIFIGNICTVFNLLGLIVFIALLSVGAGLFDFVFVIIYIANFSIGIIQEIRAKHCIEKLSLLANKNFKVVRDGENKEIAVSEIVLDDVIVLGIGDQIPADCKILSGNVEVNESLLTGESVPVKKQEGDELFAASFIVAGNCYAQAVKVGKDNYAAQLSAKAKKYRKPRSELMQSLRIFIKTVALVIVPMATAYMIKSAVILDVSVPESIRRTSTVVIGMIPSGMFLLTSVALAVGIIKLARHKTLVQDLYSLEMLARVDTICFDKTGTITDGNMSVTDVIPLQDGFDIKKIVSSVVGTLKDTNQTAYALRNYFGETAELNATAALPFNSSRKLSAVTFGKDGTYAIGAPEFILAHEQFKNIQKDIESYSAKGLRVILLAHSKSAIENDNVKKDFSPVALILIADNIRPEAFDTVKWFKDNDVAIKVISGDNPITVAEVSKRVGIENADKFISLEGLSDEEVAAAANEYTVFGRVTPEQKAILVKAMKQAGHTTAMTGDGVNDIIALKEADCAITVASGSEAARNVAHLVLMDNNFNSMPKVVHEGRRVINNVQGSASLYLMKTFFTMMLSFIILWIPKVAIYPFTLKQMNILEIAVIGIPSFFLSLQPNDARIKGTFIKNVLFKSVPSALLMVISVGLVGLIKIFDTTASDETYSTIGILALTLAGAVNLFMICRPFNNYRRILFSIVAVILAAVILVVIFFGLNFLGLVRLALENNGYRHILFVLAIFLLDFPLSLLLQKIYSMLRTKNIKTETDCA